MLDAITPRSLVQLLPSKVTLHEGARARLTDGAAWSHTESALSAGKV